MNPLPSLPFPPEEPPTEESKPAEKVGYQHYPTFCVVGRGFIFGEKVCIFRDPDAPLWHGQQICTLLGIKQHKKALRRLDDDERVLGVAAHLWHGQPVILITESGLYTLILESNKPAAKVFKRWITHEVLPSLRRYGQYPAPKRLPAAQPLKLTAELDALLPDEARTLPLRTQMILAERLHYCREVELAPHPSLRKKIKHVIATGLGRKRGFNWSSIYKHHRKFTRSQCDWRVLLPHFENSGRRTSPRNGGK